MCAHLLIHLGAKSLDLTRQVADFKTTLTSWESYDAEVNELSIVNLKK
jgi:hypothetical protein